MDPILWNDRLAQWSAINKYLLAMSGNDLKASVRMASTLWLELYGLMDLIASTLWMETMASSNLKALWKVLTA